MKHLYLFAISLLAWACLSASAVQVVSNVHYFSREVALPSLAEDLRNVEDLAAQRRYADAATALQLVLRSDSQDVRDELDVDRSTGGPLAFLDQYPDTGEKFLLEAIDIARANINPEHPAQIREFYDALTTLALRQPGDEAHIKTVATILNEKQKLETIMPELKN